MPTFKDSLAAGGRIVPGNERGDPIEVVDYDPSWPGRFEDKGGGKDACSGHDEAPRRPTQDGAS